MAQYTILTTREQEAGLTYSFDHYAEAGQTKDQFLQSRVNRMVLNPMFVDFKSSQAVALDKSIATIPAANESKASQEIQAVIVANGGTIVPVGPPPNPIPPPALAGHATGDVPAARGTSGNPIQAGGGDKKAIPPSRPDGAGDK